MIPGHPQTSTAAGPQGPVEYLLTGSGRPSTAFVPGLASSIEQVRPFGSGVPGTRAFVQLRGHGAAPIPVGPDGAPDPGDSRTWRAS